MNKENTKTKPKNPQVLQKKNFSLRTLTVKPFLPGNRQSVKAYH